MCVSLLSIPVVASLWVFVHVNSLESTLMRETKAYSTPAAMGWFKVFLPSHELGKLKIGGPKLIPNKRASFFLLIK